MRFISTDNAKTLVILTAMGASIYVLWKLYSGAASIKNSVTETVTGLAHDAQLAAARIGAKVRASTGGPDFGADQTSAETARLARQDSQVSTGLPAAPVPEAASSGDYRPSVPEEGVPPYVMGLAEHATDAEPVTSEPVGAIT